MKYFIKLLVKTCAFVFVAAAFLVISFAPAWYAFQYCGFPINIISIMFSAAVLMACIFYFLGVEFPFDNLGR